jgi:hypothetical protein
MLRTPRALAALLLALLAGCGGGEPAATNAAGGPAEYPAAYAVDRAGLPELASKPLPEALEGADVVAETAWEPYYLIVLTEWLHERGVDLDRPRPAELTAIEEAWDMPVLVLTAEHARRHRRRLERLRPREAELRAYFEAFNEESRGDAGDAMAEYLGIVRTALREAIGQRVVVIPLED